MTNLAWLNELFGLPESASDHAELVDQFLELVHWFMAILFVGWTIYFFYTIIKFRQKKSPKADYHGVRGHGTTHIEIGVIIVEAILLLGFAFPLWGQRADEFPQGEEVLRVRAVGRQFSWAFQYPGADNELGDVDPELVPADPDKVGIDPSDPNGDDDFIAQNELVLPVGRVVFIDVASIDVIHNLSLVPMRIQQDAIPGTRAHMWFRPTKTGEWDIICGQLCGSGHGTMRGIIRVLSQEEYDAWEAGFRPADATAEGGTGGIEELPEWKEPYDEGAVLKELNTP